MLDAPDDNEAVRWYRKAAEQGFVKAYSDLSSLLKKTDPAESLKWLRLSAEHDDPQSAYELALRYSMGRGAVQSQDEAVRWLRRSAELGYNVAEYELALLYERGAGLPRDLIKARQIMEKFLPRIPLGKGR
jgi:hypothetical protein